MTLVLEPAIHDLTCVYLYTMCVRVCVYIYMHSCLHFCMGVNGICQEYSSRNRNRWCAHINLYKTYTHKKLTVFFCATMSCAEIKST